MNSSLPGKNGVSSLTKVIASSLCLARLHLGCPKSSLRRFGLNVSTNTIYTTRRQLSSTHSHTGLGNAPSQGRASALTGGPSRSRDYRQTGSAKRFYRQATDTTTARKPWTPEGNDFVEDVQNGDTGGAASGSGSRRRGREMWQIQKASLRRKFDGGWNPRKKLSPDAQDGIRALNAQQPDVYTTEVLAQEFQVSPEAIRRILRSKWKPTEAESSDRHRRWEKRGLGIWAAKTAMGSKPPRRWREMMNDKIESEGREAAVGLIRGPVAQAMLARDIEMKNKEMIHRRTVESELGKQVEPAADIEAASPVAHPINEAPTSEVAPKTRRRGRPRKRVVEPSDGNAGKLNQ